MREGRRPGSVKHGDYGESESTPRSIPLRQSSPGTTLVLTSSAFGEAALMLGHEGVMLDRCGAGGS